MIDTLDKIQSIRGLVVEGTPDSLLKAIDGLDQLRQMILRDQVTVSLDVEASSVDPEFDQVW